MVKRINRMEQNAPVEPAKALPAAPAEDVLLLREIRDSLKK
jgi:large conductance mechanosensitive channel